MSSLSFEPLIPGALWLALAASGVVLLAWYAFRRPSGLPLRRWVLSLGLMTLALALVLLVLLNPTWVREIPPPAGKPLLNVLVDASGSMAVPDGAAAGGPSGTRYQAAARTAQELAAQLGDRFEVRVRAFSDRSASADLLTLRSRTPDGQATDLSAALADALAEERPQGQAVVLLSDGIHNTPGGAQPVLEAVRRAKALAAPVYTRTMGGAVGGIDLAVEVRSPQDLAFVRQKVPVTVRVGGRGLVPGARAQVALLYEGQEVGRQEAELGGPGTPEVRFWVRQDKTGLYAYEARVEPVPGEATQANNSATYLLRVIDQPVRVLLLEGKPYWDSKFLMRTLSSVPAVELESLVRVADGRLVHRTLSRKQTPATQPAGAAPATGPAPPGAEAAADDDDAAAGGARAESWKIVTSAAEALSSPERLRKYQVIVLGREAEEFLTDAAVSNLQNWVSRDGGALVCSRGAPAAQVSQRLARMLPVKWTPSREARFRMRLTDQGRDLRWIGDGPHDDVRLAALPTLASSAQVDRSKPLAVVLATSVAPEGGGNAPAVVYQPYGTGKVVVIEGAGMWRWAFLPPQYQQQEEVYGSIWQNLLRWVTSGTGLLPGQKLALRADKVSFATEEPATATLLVREEGGNGQAPAVELTAADGTAAKTFTPAVLGEEPGSFRVSFGTLPAGRYKARVAGTQSDDVAARCAFDVRVVGREQLELAARPDLMAHIASGSGGAVLRGDAADELARRFKQYMARVRPPRYERTTAWDRPWVLVGIFVLWCVSWAVRRSGGLV